MRDDPTKLVFESILPDLNLLRQCPIEPRLFVSPFGRVYQVREDSSGTVLRLMRPKLNGDGYNDITVQLDRKRKIYKVHRLVAATFLGVYQQKMEVRHLDGVRTNNHASNLAWGTAKENAADRDSHNTTARGERNGHSLLTESQVVEMRKLKRNGATAYELANRYQIGTRAVSDICKGKRWKHVPL